METVCMHVQGQAEPCSVRGRVAREPHGIDAAAKWVERDVWTVQDVVLSVRRCTVALEKAGDEAKRTVDEASHRTRSPAERTHGKRRRGHRKRASSALLRSTRHRPPPFPPKLQPSSTVRLAGGLPRVGRSRINIALTSMALRNSQCMATLNFARFELNHEWVADGRREEDRPFECLNVGPGWISPRSPRKVRDRSSPSDGSKTISCRRSIATVVRSRTSDKTECQGTLPLDPQGRSFMDPIRELAPKLRMVNSFRRRKTWKGTHGPFMHPNSILKGPGSGR